MHGVRFYCHVSRGGAASPSGGSSSGGGRAATISTGSASAFYDDEDGDEDLLGGMGGGGGGGAAYAPPVGSLIGGAPSGGGLTDDLAIFAGMGGGGATAGAAGPAPRTVFDYDNLQVTMKVDKNPMKSNASRITLTASTVVGDASELKMMCAVPKSVAMTIGTPSGNVLATSLSEVTQTIDLVNNSITGGAMSMRLRVVWQVGSMKKKKTVEVKDI